VDDARAELFERHYLECDECFIELLAGELLVSGLERLVVERRVINGVLVLRVAAPSYLTELSTEARALCNSILEQGHQSSVEPQQGDPDRQLGAGNADALLA
jgi:hypothetical protein